MKSYSSQEIIKRLKQDGWILDRVVGSHQQYKHKTKPGTVTVPHPRKNLPIKTVRNIFKQAEIEL
ncbi:MAG: type II toxin-antitoxin system HicA family toxin [Actinobacteria bacterium]|nr:type II toxin-antitoxin system HicA family toxin [Actinomycetota bacterium]